MDSAALNASLSFLEECLNEGSSIVKHEQFKSFLRNLQFQLVQRRCKVRINVRPIGVFCVNCQKYISSTNLENSLKLDEKSYFCSLICLQELKNIQTNRSRKSTRDSASNDEETEGNPSKKCLIS